MVTARGEEKEAGLLRFSPMAQYFFGFHDGEPRITRETVDLVSDAAARHHAVRRARDLTRETPRESGGESRRWIEVRDEEGRNLLRLSFGDAANFGGIVPSPEKR